MHCPSTLKPSAGFSDRAHSPALTWMVYHILNLLGNLTHTLVEKGPNAAVAPLRHFAEDLDLVQDGKFNGIPVAVATDLVPLSYVSFLPFLCFMRAAFCCTSGHAAYDRQSMPRTGRRILRRIGLGVRASGQLLAIASFACEKERERTWRFHVYRADVFREPPGAYRLRCNFRRGHDS